MNKYTTIHTFSLTILIFFDKCQEINVFDVWTLFVSVYVDNTDVLILTWCLRMNRKKKGQDSVNPKSSVHELFHQNGLVPDVIFGKKIPTSDLTMSTSHKKKGLHHLKYTFNLKTYINNKKNKRGDKWSRKSKSFQVTGVPSLCHQILSPKVEEKDNKDYMTLSTLDNSNPKKEKLVHNVFPFSEDVLVKGDEMEDIRLVCPDSFFII